jgi:hypothetical protein
MKNSKTAWLIFKRIIIILFIIFIILYFQVETGTISQNKNKTIITQENLKKFEEDIKNGEYIDIKNYTETNKVNTSNIVSDMGYYVSSKTSHFFGEELSNIFEMIGKLIK